MDHLKNPNKEPFWSWRQLAQRENRDSELYKSSQCTDSYLSHRNNAYESTICNQDSSFSVGGENTTDGENRLLILNQSLKDAIIEKNQEAVEFYLRNGADPNSQFGVKMISALHLAINVGELKTIDILLKRGADVKVTDSQGMTPLHLAAELGLAEVVPRLIEVGADINAHELIRKNGKGQETPLHRAAGRGHLEVLYQLVSSGAIVNVCDIKRRTPLQYAVFMGHIDSVEFLLQNEADVQVIDTEEDTLLHICAQRGHAAILELLLAHPKMSKIINFPNIKGRIPLHKAAYCGSPRCIQLLLKAGADLGVESKSVSSAIELILQLPNGGQILCDALNESIITNGIDPSEVSCRITLDYSILLSKHKTQQMGIVKVIVDDPKGHLTADLIRHPVIESFLCRKWRKIRFLFFLNVLLYMFYMAGLTAYILTAASSRDANDSMNLNNTESQGETNDLNTVSPHVIMWTTQVLMAFFIPIKIFLETLQFATLKLRYVKRFETWVKLSALISSVIVIFAETAPWSELVHEFSAAAVLLGWSEITFLLGRLPTFGVYALMFYSVAKNLLKFILAYVFFLAGFSFSFYVMFMGKKDAFKSPLTSFLRTFSFMLGDQAFDEYLLADKHELVPMAQVIYFFFLVMVCLILMNLLIGLAVNDIKGLQKEGLVERLRKQADFIIYLENVASNRFICCIPGCCFKLTERIKNWITMEPAYTFSPAGRKQKGFLPSSIVGRTVAIVKQNQVSVKSSTNNDTAVSTLLQDCLTSIKTLRTQMESLESRLNKTLGTSFENAKDKKKPNQGNNLLDINI